MKNKDYLRKFAVILISSCLVFEAGLFAAPHEAYRSYARGLLAMKAGDLEAALTEYRRVSDLDKEAVVVFRDLAVLYWQTGRQQEAFDAAEKLESLSTGMDEDALSTQLFLGSFYLLAGQSEKARRAWERSLAIDPDNEVAILYLAAFHSSDNEPSKAVSYWNRYLRKEPGSSEGYYQLGVVREKLGQAEKAKNCFLKAISLKPDNSDARLALAQLYEKLEKPVAAAQEYERYIELVPENMTVLLYLGGLYYRMKNYSAAEAVFLKAKIFNPKDDSINFWLGVIAEEKKDWDNAIAYFTTISDREENAAILTRLGYYYSAKKDFDKAIECLRKVAKLEPENPASYYLLGLAYFDMKKYRLAEENMKKSVAIKGDVDEMRFHLGVLYDQWGKFDKAIPEFEQVLKLNPGHHQTYNYLAYSFAERGIRLDEAETLVAKALELDPGNGSYMDSLGWIYFKKGRYDDAEKELMRAAETFSDPVIWEHLGDTRVKKNDLDGAWDAYEKARALDPKNKSVQKKLRDLEKRVMPSTLQRKVLKRAAGNLLQLTSLKMNFLVSGDLNSVNFRFAGIFQYVRPLRWRLDVLGSFLAPQVILIRNEGLQFYPASLADTITPDKAAMLEQVADFFNAGLLDEFDSNQAKSEMKCSYFRYTLGGKTLVIDRRNGAVKEYRVKNGLTLRLQDYKQEEGIFLPGRILLYSKPDKLSAKIQLQNYSVNQPIKDEVFLSLSGPEK